MHIATKSIPIVLNFLNLLAKSILVPTPSVHETITGSLILNFEISYIDAKLPIFSFKIVSFVFLTLLLDIEDICLTNLLANEIFTLLFCNYFAFFSLIK